MIDRTENDPPIFREVLAEMEHPPVKVFIPPMTRGISEEAFEMAVPQPRPRDEHGRFTKETS